MVFNLVIAWLLTSKIQYERGNSLQGFLILQIFWYLECIHYELNHYNEVTQGHCLSNHMMLSEAISIHYMKNDLVLPKLFTQNE